MFVSLIIWLVVLCCLSACVPVCLCARLRACLFDGVCLCVWLLACLSVHSFVMSFVRVCACLLVCLVFD